MPNHADPDGAEIWLTVERLESDYSYSRDPSIAADLLRARHRAFSQLTGRPAPPWPPTYRDPFSDRAGRTPEIRRDELTSELLGGAILHHGCLLVRGLFSAEQVELLRADLAAAFAERDAFLRAGADAIPSANYSRFRPNRGYSLPLGEREWGERAGGVWTADSPRALCDSVGLLRNVGIQRVVQDYFGEPPALSVNKSTFRRIGPEAVRSWHQDGDFLGTDVRSVNVWVALTECGESTNAPGLGVAPRRFDYLLPTQTEGATFPHSIGEPEVVRALDGTELAFPHFGPGDALLFDEMCVHCTGTKPGMTAHREELETWLYAPSTFPRGYVPIAL